ncbi:mitochondrial 2-oxoglutarate/malate carrier protein-like isoform X1 [Notamacropus eugenii]|uniref:mitochondrial 2-oxoglutarate/malate carrier protein-like isoform X1 n=1 Tax=Notamacropus eugenii TaxID=9315 RepID=UPI003B66D7F0
MVATLLAQFFKVVKNELQLKREGAETGEYKTNFPDVLNILKSESDRGLFAGPSAGFMHQATFKQPECSTYNVLCVQPMKEDETSLYFFMRSLVGMTTRDKRALVGTPPAVDSQLDLMKSRGYKYIFDVFPRVTEENYILNFWRSYHHYCKHRHYSQSK